MLDLKHEIMVGKWFDWYCQVNYWSLFIHFITVLYLIGYHILFVIFMWAYWQTIFTEIGRVPAKVSFLSQTFYWVTFNFLNGHQFSSNCCWKYSRIPLIQHPLDWTGAGLPNIRHYRRYLNLAAIRRMCTCQLFSCQHKKKAFSFIIGPVMGFCLEHIAVNHFYGTLSSCAKLDCSTVCCLKGSFTLSVAVTQDHSWSFCFLIS